MQTKKLKRAGLYIMASLLISTSAFGEGAKADSRVVTYPAPASEAVQTGFSVYANGKKVDLYRALSPKFEGGEYYFGMFDFDGTVEVKVASFKNLSKAELFPAKFKVVSQSAKELVFSADKPFSAIVIHDERKMPVVIFGNPIEKDVPDAKNPNVVYFGPGVHVADLIRLKSGQTLYIAGGAVVKSRIVAEGDDIVVRGRGVLSGELFPRFSTGNLASFGNCKNIVAEGIILKDSMSWTFVMRNCENVNINNIKICSSRMINDDAIDICNSRNVKIENVFARAQDDIIAIKGTGEGSKIACENILVENCVFWTDLANTFRIGYECEAEAMRNIVVRNIDIPFYSINFNPPDDYWSNTIIWLQAANDMPMHDIHFENLNVRSDGSDTVVLMACPRITKFRGSKTAGKLYDCSIKNLTISGKEGKFKGTVYFKGLDAAHDVKDISLENITYFGRKIGADYNYFIDTKENTSNISIK